MIRFDDSFIPSRVSSLGEPTSRAHHAHRPWTLDSPMRASSLLAAFALIAATGATELTPDNWEEETIGRTVFIKFLAPW